MTATIILDKVTVSEHKISKFGQLYAYKVEDPFTLPNGHEISKTYEVISKTAPPVGALISLKGEPDIEKYLNSKGTASAYIKIWKAEIEIHGVIPQVPDVITAEQAAEILASAPIPESEVPF